MGQERRIPRPRVQIEPEFEERWPGSSRLATACFTNLWALQSRLEARSQGWLKREGYPSSAAFNVLTVLHGADGPLLPSEIADRMLVSRPTITGILDSLERAGHILRKPHPQDGRMRLVEITRRARTQVESSMGRLHLLERRIMTTLTRNDQARLLRIVGQLQAAVEVAEFEGPGAGRPRRARRPRSSENARSAARSAGGATVAEE